MEMEVGGDGVGTEMRVMEMGIGGDEDEGDGGGWRPGCLEMGD